MLEFKNNRPLTHWETLSTEALRMAVAQVAGILAERDGAQNVDRLLRRIGDRLNYRPRSMDEEIGAIFERVSNDTGVPIADIKSNNPRKDIYAARKAVIHALAAMRQADGSPMFGNGQIATIIGAKDHSTVAHALRSK